VVLAVRAVAVDGTPDLLLDATIRTRRLEQLRGHASVQTGALDLPATLQRDAAMLRRAPRGRWIVATRDSSGPTGGTVAILRARVVERGAGR
jgi:hypothetical protein